MVPIFWWNLAMKKRVEMFGKNWLGSISWGWGLGIFYWLLLTRMTLKIPLLSINTIGIAIATAIVEEMVFSGFVVGYLERFDKGSWWNLWLTAGMAAVLRLPILTFVYKSNSSDVLAVVALVFFSTTLNAWIRQRTGNVSGSILARIAFNLGSLS